jgi:hypothetical protein
LGNGGLFKVLQFRKGFGNFYNFFLQSIPFPVQRVYNLIQLEDPVFGEKNFLGERTYSGTWVQFGMINASRPGNAGRRKRLRIFLAVILGMTFQAISRWFGR